jgi:hypothetical protein
MKARRFNPAKVPVMLEPVLEKLVRGFSADDRRAMARVYECWAAQLYYSAELMELGTASERAKAAIEPGGE